MADITLDLSGDMSGNMSQPILGESKDRLQLPPSLNLSAPVAQAWLKNRYRHLKPWLQFFASSKFNVPKSLPQFTTRVMKNIDEFQSNYICIFIILIFYCLITSPLLLLAIAASLGGCYILSKRNLEKKIVIMDNEVTLAQQYLVVAILSFPLFYLAGAGAAVFWVLGASIFFILLHATFYASELSLDANFSQPLQQV